MKANLALLAGVLGLAHGALPTELRTRRIEPKQSDADRIRNIEAAEAKRNRKNAKRAREAQR